MTTKTKPTHYYQSIIDAMRAVDPSLPPMEVSMTNALVPTVVLECEGCVRRFPVAGRIAEKNIREVWMSAYQKRLDRAERRMEV